MSYFTHDRGGWFNYEPVCTLLRRKDFLNTSKVEF